MAFTRKNTINEILNTPYMKEYFEVLFSEFIMDLFPKDKYDEPLEEVEKIATTPWNEPFWVITDQLLSAANAVLDITVNHTKKCIPLWQDALGEQGDWQPKDVTNYKKEDVFLVAPTKACDVQKPAMIICPGGGYVGVCFGNEGTPISERMEEAGYCAFELRYRTAPAVYPEPQEDLALAIKYVRAHAKEYNINPEKVIVMGFSAAGHLCASVAALHEKVDSYLQEELYKIGAKVAKSYEEISVKPDGVCLCYPVISFTYEPHEGSFENLTNHNEALRAALSVENLVTADYPKTFIWACEDDDIVPVSNTKRMIKVLEEKGIQFEGHIYEEGGHGCGLAYTKSAKGWSEAMINFFNN